MPNFVDDNERVYVSAKGVSDSLPDEGIEYIAIRTDLSLGEMTRLQSLAVSIDKAGNPEARIEEFLSACNEVAIVDWFLKGRDGQPVPYSRASVKKLSTNSPLVDQALREFSIRNPTLSRRRT